MQHKRQRGVFLLHLLHVPRSKGAGSASCRGGRASAKTRPDSGSDPQTPCPARTLKLSSRRHRLPARPPTAPLLSGLLAAPAQCQRPRDSARSEHARPCGLHSAKVPAQAHRRPAPRPPPLPHPPKTWREELSSSDSPSRRAASGTGGLPAPGCAVLAGPTLPRCRVTASCGCPQTPQLPAHNPREPPQPSPPRDRPLWRFHFLNWTAGHALGKHRLEFPESVGKSCLSISRSPWLLRPSLN